MNQVGVDADAVDVEPASGRLAAISLQRAAVEQGVRTLLFEVLSLWREEKLDGAVAAWVRQRLRLVPTPDRTSVPILRRPAGAPLRRAGGRADAAYGGLRDV